MEAPSELSSSRPAGQHQQALVDAQGNGCKVSLQAVELEGRPKLVRTLRNAGALVMSNTKEADIILVDSLTESGRRLIRMWGHDPSKLVLEHSWLQKCIEAGRPLLEEDAWGDALAVDDGQPVEIDGVVIDEEVQMDGLAAKSPLPTPRVTPVDLATQKRAAVRSPEYTIPPRRTERPPPQVTPLIPPPAQGEMGREMPQDQSSLSQSFQQPRSTSFVQAPQIPPQPTQDSYAYHSFPAQSTAPFPFPHSHSHMVTMGPTVGPNIQSYNLQSQNLMSAYVTLLDVMRHSAERPFWSGQNPSIPLTQPLPDPTQLMFPTQPTLNSDPSNRHTQLSASASTRSVQSSFDCANADMSRPVSDPQNCSRDSGTMMRHSSAEELNSQSPHVRTTHRKYVLPPASANVRAPLISRKGLPAVKHAHPPKRSRKGKERAISTESSEEPEPGKHSETYESPSPTPSSPTTPSPRPLNIVARKTTGEVFLSDAGKPLHFFVQVDLHGRHSVVSNIKKNKGKIVNNIPDADYVILYSRSKSAFDGLLSEATAAGKLPIQAAFVIGCIKECALLHEEDYAVKPGPPGRPPKRGRQNASPTLVETPEIVKKKVKRKLLDNEAKEFSATSSKRPVEETMKTRTVDTEPSSIRNTQSPSPPPAETRQMMKSGRYYFTEVEDEYFLRYAKYCLDRDPSMSHTALMHKVHNKMPHHTVASWMAHIDQKLRKSLDDVRKRANVTKRMHPPDQSPEQLDFEVITHFFARGGGDDDNDERVWQELEKYHPCRTANSWPEYYAAHERKVYARIEELMSEYAQ